jgi:hypothetical protein
MSDERDDAARKVTAKLSARGNEIDLELDKISRIDVADFLNITKHGISRDGDRVMHIVEFSDGREAEFTFRITGSNTAKIEVFRLEGGTIRLSPDGVVTFLKTGTT